MFCPNCGHEASDADRFCASCGRALGIVLRDVDERRLVIFQGEAFPLATPWRRLGALAIDAVLMYLVWGMAIGFVFMVRGAPVFAVSPEEQVEAVTGIMFPGMIALGVALPVMWWLFEAIGWTPGKLAVGIRVIRWDGSRPGAAHGLIRHAGRIVSTYAMFLGLMWVFWDRFRQGWHDKMAQTYVVRVPADFAYRAAVTDPREVEHSQYVPGVRKRLRRGPIWVAAAALGFLIATGCGAAMSWSTWQDIQRIDWDAIGNPAVGQFMPVHPVPTAAELANAPPLSPRHPSGCEAPGRRVCFVVVGAEPEVPVTQIASHYGCRLGIGIGVLPSVPLAASVAGLSLVDHEREQVEGSALIRLAHETYPTLWPDPDVTVIVITAHDLMLTSAPTWRFVFGTVAPRGSGGGFAAVSTSRMNNEAHGLPADRLLLERRLFAMVGKFVGMLYYGLSPTDDPESPVYGGILSLADLERMGNLEDVVGRSVC